MISFLIHTNWWIWITYLLLPGRKLGERVYLPFRAVVLWASRHGTAVPDASDARAVALSLSVHRVVTVSVSYHRAATPSASHHRAAASAASNSRAFIPSLSPRVVALRVLDHRASALRLSDQKAVTVGAFALTIARGSGVVEELDNR